MVSELVFSNLTFDRVISIVEDVVGERFSNLCLQRNSYINRVYELETIDKERLIVKFYRPKRWTKEMILTEHDFLLTSFDNGIPVIPPYIFDDESLFFYYDIPFAIFPKKGGRPIDELSPELWQETGRLIGRIHELGRQAIVNDRTIWRPSIATRAHLDTLKSTSVLPADLQEHFCGEVERFIENSDTLFDSIDLFLIHGDCHFGNLIYRPEESLYIVDFDDCVIGPAIQDLWMLLPESVDDCEQEIALFKEGYNLFSSFPDHELALIPTLSLMRQIHFAAWCAIQCHEPQFKASFPQWGDSVYWRALVRELYAT